MESKHQEKEIMEKDDEEDNIGKIIILYQK